MRFIKQVLGFLATAAVFAILIHFGTNLQYSKDIPENPGENVIDPQPAKAGETDPNQEINDAQNELKRLDELVGRNPLDYRTRDQRGFCHLRLANLLFGIGESDDNEAALKDFTVAIESYPNDANAYAGRAEALLELVRTDDAYADITNALKIDPNNAVAFEALGEYELTASKEAEAMNAFSKAIELDPSLNRAAIMLSELKAKASKVESDAASWKSGNAPEGFAEQVEASRAKVYKSYPALKNPASRFSQFTAGYNGLLQSQQPDFFHDPEWPMKLAQASKSAYVNQLQAEATQLIAPIEDSLRQDKSKLNDQNVYLGTSGVFTGGDKRAFEDNIQSLHEDIKSLESQLDNINKEYRQEEQSPGSTEIDAEAPAPLPDRLPAPDAGENPGTGGSTVSATPPPARGSTIVITATTILYFHDEFYRVAQPGEEFQVYEYRPSEKKLYILSKDANGNPIGLNIPDQ